MPARFSKNNAENRKHKYLPNNDTKLVVYNANFKQTNQPDQPTTK